MGKIVLGFLAWFALTGGAVGQDLFPLQPHPEGVAWPTTEWETGDLPEDSAAEAQRLINEAMALSVDDVMGQTRAIVVIHNGRLVAETYAEGFGPHTKQMSWSLAKSVTHGLVGRAVQLDLIEDIDAPMPTPFTDDDPRSKISWRNWLQMTDGLEYSELGEPDILKNNVVQMMFGAGKRDVAAYMAAETGIAHQPGEVWNYSTGGFHLVGQAVQKEMSLLQIGEFRGFVPETGRWELMDTEGNIISKTEKITLDSASRMSALLFDPIGMDAQPEFDPSGTYLGGSNIWASAHDFAKFGYLYLRDGVWEGERLLAEGWVDFARTPGPDQNIKVYGAGFWLALPEGGETTLPRARKTAPFDVFAANGSEGQTISIVPSRDLVIVRLGLMPNNNQNWNALFEWNQKLARAFPEIVIE
ncbi:MAG: serine hydrolase [Pseudomonadota bacterium]